MKISAHVRPCEADKRIRRATAWRFHEEVAPPVSRSEPIDGVSIPDLPVMRAISVLARHGVEFERKLLLSHLSLGSVSACVAFAVEARCPRGNSASVRANGPVVTLSRHG
jgi:hypothetical protein